MRRQNSLHSVSNGTIVGGVLIGTAIGAATAYLLSSRGKELRNTLAETCCNISEQAKDIAEQIAERSKTTSRDLSDRYFNGTAHRSNDQINWIIGGIGAAVLGISAIAYLSKDSSKELRNNILHTFETITGKTSELAGEFQETVHEAAENLEDRVTCWVKTAQQFLDSVNGYAENAAKKVASHRNGESTIDKAVDWAAFGIRLYQSLKK